MRSTAVSQIGITLQEIYPLLEMEAQKRQGKVRWLLDNERDIFENKDVEAGIIRPLVGIMRIFVLRLARRHTLAATLPLPFTSVFPRRTNPWASKVRAFWRKCHPSSSVCWQSLSSGTSTPMLPLAALYKRRIELDKCRR